jgi:hypothetical protein
MCKKKGNLFDDLAKKLGMSSDELAKYKIFKDVPLNSKVCDVGIRKLSTQGTTKNIMDYNSNLENLRFFYKYQIDYFKNKKL